MGAIVSMTTYTPVNIVTGELFKQAIMKGFLKHSFFFALTISKTSPLELLIDLKNLT